MVPTLVDLDQDGDLDMFGPADHGIPVFYENVGSASSAVFDPRQLNPFGLIGNSFWRAVADLDNDGDLDLLTPAIDSATSQTVFHYYENTGTANAPVYSAPAQVSPFGLIVPESGVIVGQLVDMDDDGDFDYLGVDEYDEAFYYYENTGSVNSPMFSTPVTDPFGLSTLGYINSGVVGDLDLDGDLDVITVHYGQTNQFAYFAYHENTGSPASPAFASPQTNPFGLTSVGLVGYPAMGDLDADGDVDLLTIGFNYNYAYSASFYFYENDSTIVPEE